MTTAHQAMLAARVAVGRRIRQRRKEMEMTQINLAKLIGVSNTVLGEWEHGRSGVPKEKLVKIAAALEVPVADLAGIPEGMAIGKMTTTQRYKNTSLAPPGTGERFKAGA